ncbi:hypothetical protein [Haladaptatus halobius]|uniref:hypothetical protein n=1 Tax=Haladaptatus halobius TaxID=2884875 RepID=UPI001D0AAB83|nr:hypothetical protein [Haladaptatus halobius]
MARDDGARATGTTIGGSAKIGRRGDTLRWERCGVRPDEDVRGRRRLLRRVPKLRNRAG